MNARITTTLVGTIAGPIWQPGFDCERQVNIDRVTYHHTKQASGAWERVVNERRTLEEMLEKATSDGDFQHCEFIEGHIKVEATTPRKSGAGYTTRTRYFDLSLFPSAAQYMVAEL